MIAILDYGVGNLASVAKAFAAVGLDARVVDRPRDAARARGVVLPGVGAFAPAMKRLRATGMDGAVLEAMGRGVPLLGICLGLQLLFSASDEGAAEGGGVPGLGVLSGRVASLGRLAPGHKVPHVGWNLVTPTRPGTLVGDGGYFYFVHSYAAVPADAGVVAATVPYGADLCAAVQADGMAAVQFHPEKSGRVGLRVLASFGRWVSAGAGRDGR